MDKVKLLLSREECELILKRHLESEKFELLDYNIAPLSNDVEGFLGEHYIIKMNIKRNNDTFPVSFFAKVPPVEHDLQMEFVRTSNAFEKEIFFYKKLIPEFKAYCSTFDSSIVPKLYFSRDNTIVVMENLQQKRFCVAPFKDLLDVKHIKYILKVLSKMHSASIIYEERKSEKLGKPFRLTDEYQDFLLEGFFREDKNYLGYKWHIASQKGVLAVIDKMDESETFKNDFKNKFKELGEKCFEIIKPTKKFRNVVCHGDLWMKNVLFRYENNIPVECKLIDFQLMKYNPPAFDVLKIIFQSTTSEMRKNHFEDFLKYYYDNLCKELTLGDVDVEKVLPRDQFQASIKYMLPQCKVETSYYYSYQKFGPEFLKKLMENPSDFRTYSFIDRSPFMVKYYNPGSVYKKWMDEILFDIRDMLMNKYFTREDCFAILRAKLNNTSYDLIDYTVKPLEIKYGFLGEHLKIHVKVKLNNERVNYSFFAKVLPESAFNSFVITSGSFNNEKFMFDHVFQKMDRFGINDIYNCVPKCFYSRSNDIIVFEDLNESGFQVLDKHKSLNMEEISVIVKCLAKLHGCVLVLEENLTKRNGHKFRIEHQYKNDLRETNYVQDEKHLGFIAVQAAVRALFHMADLFPDPDSAITDGQLKYIINQLYKKTIYDLTSPSKKYRNVICHGDLWANNIMLKYEPGQPVDCRIVDFQNVRICPPAHDLMSFIYVNTSRKFRTNFMTDVLHLYHTELGKILEKHNCNIENIIPLDEFLESCEEYKVFAVNFAPTMIPIVMMRAEEMEVFFENPELCHHVIFESRDEFIQNMCEKDEHYKTLLSESMKDLRVLCEHINPKYILDC